MTIASFKFLDWKKSFHIQLIIKYCKCTKIQLLLSIPLQLYFFKLMCKNHVCNNFHLFTSIVFLPSHWIWSGLVLDLTSRMRWKWYWVLNPKPRHNTCFTLALLEHSVSYVRKPRLDCWEIIWIVRLAKSQSLWCVNETFLASSPRWGARWLQVVERAQLLTLSCRK